MIKKLFSNSVIYGLAPQISKIAGIFALPIITKDLTALDFGVWGIVMAYVSSLQALFMMGLGVVLSNSFFKIEKQYSWLWRQIYGFLTLWGIPITLIIGVVLYLVMPAEVGGNTLTLIVLILVPGLIAGPIDNIGIYYYQLNQKPTPIAIRTAVFGLLTVGLNIYTISYLKLGYMGWAWSIFIVRILSKVSYMIPMFGKLNMTPIFNFKWRLIKQSLRVGMPTIPHKYAGFLLQSADRIVMDRIHVNTSSIGGYNLAANFGNYFQMMAMAINKAITPMMLTCYKKKDDREGKRLIRVSQVALLFATFFFAVWAKEIFIVLIKNEELRSFYKLSIILVMAVNYRPMYIAAMSRLFYEEKTKLSWRISFVAGTMNVFLNIALIPIFGFEIAAYSTFFSLMFMGFSGHYMPKVRRLLNISYDPHFWLAIIIGFTIFGYFLVDQSLYIKIISSVVMLIPFGLGLKRALRKVKVGLS